MGCELERTVGTCIERVTSCTSPSICKFFKRDKGYLTLTEKERQKGKPLLAEDKGKLLALVKEYGAASLGAEKRMAVWTEINRMVDRYM